jgi:hypothetical protein
MKRICLAVFLGLVSGVAVRAEFHERDVGANAGSFLNLAPGARNLAMGETGAATGQGGGASYWNPALLGWSPHAEWMLSHSFLVEDVAHSFIGFDVPVRGGFGAGGSLTFVDVGSINQIDDAGQNVGSFNPTDLVANLGGSTKFGGLHVGVSGKYISSRIIHNASALSGDAGLAYQSTDMRNILGFSVQNLAGKMRFDAQEEKLLRTYRAGASHRWQNGWLATIETNASSSQSPTLAGGAEWTRTAGAIQTAIRGGYSGALARGKTGIAGATLGFGVSFSRVRLDYAWIPLADLGQTHHLTFVFWPQFLSSHP